MSGSVSFNACGLVLRCPRDYEVRDPSSDMGKSPVSEEMFQEELPKDKLTASEEAVLAAQELQKISYLMGVGSTTLDHPKEAVEYAKEAVRISYELLEIVKKV